MRTLATKQPSNQDFTHQKPVKKAPVPVARSFSPGLTGSAMLQRKPGCACGGGCPRCQEESLLQTKLKIGEPGDEYEQEADRVADEVMRMPEPSVQRQVEPMEEDEEEEETLQTKHLAEQITPLVQRQVEPIGEEEEEEEETLQTKTTSGQPPTVSSSLQNRITALQGGGQPLPQSERAFFEPRFGVDFSKVRVHADSKAAETAGVVNARAFTLGKDIVFGAGQYQPSASEGRRLLAHELTHVLQQNQNIGTVTTSQLISRQLDQPTKDKCAGWKQDCSSFCRKVTDQAYRDMEGSKPPLPKDIDCRFWSSFSTCGVTFKNGKEIRVSIKDSTTLQVWRRRGATRVWECHYAYNCDNPKHELVVKRVGLCKFNTP